ncbi:MAG: hypothetical protein ACLQME_25105 [Alphaproteobacteria bacterium]
MTGASASRRFHLRARVGAACGVIACLLAACASSTPPATDQEKSQAEESYVSCLRNSARIVDDGNIDATSIAEEIEPLCAAQFSAYEETYGRGLDRKARRIFDAKSAEFERESAIAAILQERAARRAQPSQPSN